MNWETVKRSHVIEAIDFFERSSGNFPQARNTFLKYKNKKYPAKHLRWIAYKIATGEEISKGDFAGGKETVDFFTKRGFSVEYQGKTYEGTYKGQTKKETDNIKPDINKSKRGKSGKRLNPTKQKNHLQILLQKEIGILETEKQFDWLKTPEHRNLTNDYGEIIHSLENYRNHKRFFKPNYKLSCDFVIEQKKIIIEYDERQHFTEARKLTLLKYPTGLEFYFSLEDWIKYCDKTKAKDNDPIDRDEKRAFYDSVRDIEAAKHGYKLFRIKHGEFDWSNSNAKEYLLDLLKFSGKVKSEKTIKQSESNEYKIGRLVFTNEISWNPSGKLINKFISTLEKVKVEFLITPGGFLSYNLPNKYKSFSIDELERKHLRDLFSLADEKVMKFIEHIPKPAIDILNRNVKYFSIGIDFGEEGKYNEPHIELVALYAFKQKKVINLTGKFYPTSYQKKHLIKVKDFNSKFIQLGDDKVLILGCHDLSIFNPRGQANLGSGSYKAEISKEFYKRFEQEKPNVIIQHPHVTTLKRTWLNAWKNIEKKYPFVTHYASGIYAPQIHKEKDNLVEVLNFTKKGKVIDVIEKTSYLQKMKFW